MDLNKSPIDHVPILETAFGGLSLDEEVSNKYFIPQASSEAGSDLFEEYKKYPASSFERPSLFRVIHSISSIDTNGDIYSRLCPPPHFENLDLSDLCLHVQRHASLSNRIPTPFISLTPDLMRALHLAFCTYSKEQEVTVLLICPWRLNPGSYVPCNDLRAICGLPRAAIYNTEILVWGQVPAKSILHRWQRTQLLQCGLGDTFPSLSRLSPEMKLNDVRNRFQDDFPSFSPRKVAETLVKLGMKPSLLRIKQIFLFLLGQCAGFCVEKELAAVENKLEMRFPEMIQEFEQAVHEMTVSAGRRFLRSYHRDTHAKAGKVHWPLDDPFGMLERQKYQRRCRKLRAICYDKYYCPDFKSWWVRREESDLSELEIQQMTDCANFGLQRWLSEIAGG